MTVASWPRVYLTPTVDGKLTSQTTKALDPEEIAILSPVSLTTVPLTLNNYH